MTKPKLTIVGKDDPEHRQHQQGDTGSCLVVLLFVVFWTCMMMGWLDKDWKATCTRCGARGTVRGAAIGRPIPMFLPVCPRCGGQLEVDEEQ